MQFRILDQYLYPYKFFSCSSIQWRIVKTNLERAWKEARSVISILFACNVTRRIVKGGVAIQNSRLFLYPITNYKLFFSSIWWKIVIMIMERNPEQAWKEGWFLPSILSSCNITRWIIRGSRVSFLYPIISVNYFLRRLEEKLTKRNEMENVKKRKIGDFFYQSCSRSQTNRQRSFRIPDHLYIQSSL